MDASVTVFAIVLSIISLLNIASIPINYGADNSTGLFPLESLNDNVNDNDNDNNNNTLSNQYVVVLKNAEDKSTIQSIASGVEEHGGKIIAIYDQVISGFAFKTDNKTTTSKVLDYLKNQPLVESITVDRQASIFPN